MAKAPLQTRIAQAILLLLALSLSVVSFFALLELTLTLAATVIYHTMESAVRSKYALVTVRNVYLIVGGMGLVAFVIGLAEYCIKRLGRARLWRLLAVALAVEAAVIVASWLVTAR